MFLQEILFLPIIFLLGLVSSYEDYWKGVIRNKWLVMSLVCGVLAYGVMLFGQMNFYYLGVVILNSLISLFVGYVMWKYRLWSAGDSKLFAVLAFLMPLEFYSKTFLPVFPSFVLLVNVFSITIVYLLLRTIFLGLRYLDLKEMGIEDRVGFNFSANIFKFFSSSRNYGLVSFFLLMMLGSRLLEPILLPHGIDWVQWRVVVFAILIMVAPSSSKVFEKKYVFYSVLFFLFWTCAGIVFASRGDAVFIIFGIIFKMVIFSVIFSTIYNLIDVYLRHSERARINLRWLRVGVVIDKADVEKLDLYEEISRHPNGLGRKQVALVKERAASKEIRSVIVKKPFSFGAFIFAGVILTLVLRGSLVNLIMEWVA